MGTGYPLHIDATSEAGKGGLFLCLDGWRGWVLHAVKIASENETALLPAVAHTLAAFGEPVAVVRDLGAAGAKAVAPIRQRAIPDLICHYHFLGAIGKKLFDTEYAVLRQLLRRSKVRGGLRELLRGLRKQCAGEVYQGKFGQGRLREALPALLLWLLEGAGRKDPPYPFALPHLRFPPALRPARATGPNGGCRRPAPRSSGAYSNKRWPWLPDSTKWTVLPGPCPGWSRAGRSSASYVTSCG